MLLLHKITPKPSLSISIKRKDHPRYLLPRQLHLNPKQTPHKKISDHKNRNLKDIIIIDNLAHSFVLQPDNRIPIIEYINNKYDKELLGL